MIGSRLWLGRQAMESVPASRPSAAAGVGADPALAMAAIMENQVREQVEMCKQCELQVEEMRKMLNKFKAVVL